MINSVLAQPGESLSLYLKTMSKESKNWRMFARRFDDNTERIEAIREFVTDNIMVGVDYADKDNPILKLCNVGENEPFAVGNVGDYVVNDNDTFRIIPKESDELVELMLNQK